MKKVTISLSFFISVMSFSQTVINNQSLIEMKKAGLSEEIIKTKIASEESNFDVSTTELSNLKKANFSDETINLIIQKNAALKAYSQRTGTDVTNASTVSNSKIITSIENAGDKLILNKSITLNKGGDIQIYIPAGGQDFMFVKPKSGGFGLKLLSGVADVVGSGASTIGLGSGNINTMANSIKVLQTVNTVQEGIKTAEQIQNLNISNKAKKIAGKKMTILEWQMDKDGYVITAEFDKKKYLINLQEAVLAGEVKL